MGWDEEKALYCDVNLILIGMEGRLEMLTQIFSDGKKEPELEKTLKDLPMAERFKIFAREHNAVFNRKH